MKPFLLILMPVTLFGLFFIVGYQGHDNGTAKEPGTIKNQSHASVRPTSTDQTLPDPQTLPALTENEASWQKEVVNRTIRLRFFASTSQNQPQLRMILRNPQQPSLIRREAFRKLLPHLKRMPASDRLEIFREAGSEILSTAALRDSELLELALTIGSTSR